MNVTGEFALLAVVALPLAAIAGMNLALWLGGERHTLMLPLGAMEFEGLELAQPRVELAVPRAEFVDTGRHPVLAIEEEWRAAA